MTNWKAKPAGWTDNDVTDGVITAKHLNTIDRGIAGSINGTDGAIVSPAQELRMDDLGTSALLDSILRGVLDRATTGRIRPRVDYTTLIDAAPPQYIDTTYDVWWSNTAITGAWDIQLVTTIANGQVPIVNDEIEVSITTVGFAVTITQEDPSVLLATFPAARVASVAGTPMYAKFRYSGTAWLMVDASVDVI